MKLLNISLCLIAAILTGAGCGNSPNATERAQTAFAEKVWTPFLSADRCNNCHDFDNLRTTFYAGHPDSTSTCTSCHTSTVLGFATPTWHLPPAADKWNKLSDPNVVREHILEMGPGLYTHLLGEGSNAQPLVQWGFFNGPDTNGGTGTIKAGAVPAGGPNAGQIPSAALLDWIQYKANVQEWLCLERRIPGSPDLGLPDDVNCVEILCFNGGLPFLIVTVGALACTVRFRKFRRPHR